MVGHGVVRGVRRRPILSATGRDSLVEIVHSSIRCSDKARHGRQAVP